jgi:hypothetical protein
MKGITIPCYWNTAESKALEGMGIEISEDMYDIKDVIFMHPKEIDCLIPTAKPDGSMGCEFIFLGEEVGNISPLSCNEIHQMLKEF